MKQLFLGGKMSIKDEVTNSIKDIKIVVSKPYVFVEVYSERFNAYGRGFAKWNTNDMKIVRKTRIYLKTKLQELDEIKDSRYFENSYVMESITKAIKTAEKQIIRYGWNEQLGVTIATGRAIKDIVMQLNSRDEEHPITSIISEMDTMLSETAQKILSTMGEEAWGEK